MRVCSLFAGIGGIDLAFEQAGCIVVWANEVDGDACKTYRHNFPNTELVEDDIRKINADSIPDFDILTAGFPCQPFSVCGRQEGFKDNRGNLFFEIIRFLEAKHPRYVFLENVANLVEHDNGRTFNTIFGELARTGYYVRYLVADACDYGIPQHRTRTYMVAFKDEAECELFKFPEKFELNKHIVDVIDRTKKASEEYYYSPGTKKYDRLNAYISDPMQLYRFSDYGIQESKDGISFTLKANMGTWHDRVPIIKDEYGIRRITPEECLMLMGFPNAYEFPTGLKEESKYKQCGNSVTVPLIALIINQIVKAGE